MAPAGDLPFGAPLPTQWGISSGGPKPEEVVWNPKHLLPALTFAYSASHVFYNHARRIFEAAEFRIFDSLLKQAVHDN